MSTVLDIAGRQVGNDLPLALIAGPCQLEGLEHALRIADTLAEAAAREEMPLIFKASFDKANRTSLSGQRGPGLEEGLRQLEAVRAATDLPILTDIHAPEQAAGVAEVADVLQIPAFLCRQTDLLVAAAKTGAVVNVKKGQFLAPWDMVPVVEKLTHAGNSRVMLTERGASFGYNTLVADMRALPEMAATGCPVIMDATHAVQSPGGAGGASSGDRSMAPVLARAAVAVGVAGVFIECHPDPENAPSDGANMIRLEHMGDVIADLAALDRVAKARRVRP